MENRQTFTTTAGVDMPWLIYGTAWKKERTADLVVQAVQAGFRGVDTACQPKHYDERLVGAGLQGLKDLGVERDSLFVQTKFTPLAGQDPLRVPYDPQAPMETQVAQSFETSQKNLGTDYVDSLVLHSPVAPPEVMMETWGAMEAVHQAGGARQLGISNCYHLGFLEWLHAEADVQPAVVQNRFYRETGYDAELRAWCRERGIIYQSFWTLTANPHVLGSATVRSLSRNHGKTEAQILFRYLNQSGVVPLTGTSSERHMKEDLDVFGFELSSDERKEMDKLFL